MMDRPLKEILDSIRNWFSFSRIHFSPGGERKRAAPVYESPIRSKVSRFSPYNSSPHYRVIPIERESEDLSYCLPQGTLVTKHRPGHRVPMKSLRPEDTIVLDDDDDVIEVKKSPYWARNDYKKFTSTPANRLELSSEKYGCENGDQDVILVKTTKSPKEKQIGSKMAGLDYIKPRASLEKPLFHIGVGASPNGAKPKEKPKPHGSSLNGSRSSALDYSFRLDDKMKYKKLLEQNSNDSIYLTPMGKMFKSFDFSGSGEKPSFGRNTSQDKSKGSTKEMIIKVLDSMESDPVIVKDSDSEDSVIMVNPPSPKPDIKVDPVNSFKAVVGSRESIKEDWLSKLVENHKVYVKERQQQIDNIRQCSRRSEELNKDINIELLRRKVDDCLQFKDLILPEIESKGAEFPELSDEQLSMVQRAMRGDPNEVLAKKFNLNITRRDLLTLAGLNWLNDEVINFYMNLIIERGKDPKWPNTYAFNTFFYSKLIKDGPQSLRRWTKRIDLFSYDLICVPIHLGMHWCMAIVDFRDKTIRYFDSMGSANNKCLSALRNYLAAEHLDKKGTKYNTDDFDLINMEDIPQQMNGSDCGMFSCTFAEFISRDARITFTQEDMPYLRKKMVVEIMSGELLIN